STHAWCQVYLPGAGWVEFDPTNGIIGNRDLIRVAVARDPAQAVPLSGTYYGDADDEIGMTVEVQVTTEQVTPEQQSRAAAREPAIVVPGAEQHPLEELPDHTLVFLLGSRYCDTDRLADEAWSLFGKTPPGWARVQAICDYVHDRLEFGYEHASSFRTAWDGHN